MVFPNPAINFGVFLISEYTCSRPRSRLIDNHYYAIAGKAVLTKPAECAVIKSIVAKIQLISDS